MASAGQAMTVGRIKVTNGQEFNLALKDFGENVMPKQHLKFQKKVALQVLRSVVLRTPVGNPSLWAPASWPPPPGYVGGKARGGWQVTIGVPAETDVNRIDAAGAKAITAGISRMTTAQPFGVIWIVNNTPYIQPLELGWSSQAPAGMVRVALAEVATFEA